LRIDPGNPQSAEGTLFDTAVTVGVLTCLGDSLFGNAKYTTASTVVTLCSLQNFLVATVCDNTSFYT
jgi:hypothetical protein